MITVRSCARSLCTTLSIVALALAISSRPVAAQTLFSEDFSGGNPASATDYSLVNAGVATVPGKYRIVNDPSTAFTNGYNSFFDHTTGTSAGSMLFFDGSTNSANRIWYQTVTLTAGTAYTFSYWGACSGGNVPVLQIQINGANTGSLLTTSNATWAQSSTFFTPATTGSYTFAILDTNTSAAAGNDGAIDDIRLITNSGNAPEPPAFVLLSLSLIPFTTRYLLKRSRKVR